MRSLNEVRDALLESTVRIAARHGLERTTTKLIAADAQINEAYIYRCYDNKDALLQAAFHNEDVRFAAHVRKSLSVMQKQGLSWKESCFLLEIRAPQSGRLSFLSAILLFCRLPAACL